MTVGNFLKSCSWFGFRMTYAVEPVIVTLIVSKIKFLSPWNPEINPQLYKGSVHTSQRKQSADITKTTQSILCAESTIVNCRSRSEYVNTSCA